ncbi:MAG: ABC transporter ATP-binding protein [Limisphaerales bacterium]
MRVSIRRVTHGFGATPVLRDVSLDIAERELFFLLGPSGCGKTTLLRLIAGFYQADAGEIFFGERRMNGVEPHLRNAGMVFQNYALWPHMTVAQNVGYGLEVRKVPKPERLARVREALAVVQMEHLADRTPNQLSGGQQQRVALARAIVIRPDVLLLDEPLSNLDAKLRLEMREEIRRVHARTQITTIYVTHDQAEALSLADRLAVLRDGVVEQAGPPREVYRRPASAFVAEFIGETNWLSGRVTACDRMSCSVETAAGKLTASAADGLRPGDAVRAGFRPEAVLPGPGPANNLASTVEQATYLGATEQYVLRLADGTAIKAVEQNAVAPRAAGEPFPAHVRPENVFLLRA